MLFAQQPFGMSTEARDSLAFWSDILGVVGFFLSLITIGIAILVERKIAAAKKEAKEAVDAAKREAREAVVAALGEAKRFVLAVARSQAFRELSAARLSMELAREACRSKQWVRAGGHLDAATSMLVRLVSQDHLEPALRESLGIALDNARTLVSAVRGRENKGADLSDERYARLDDTISRILAVEARFAAILPESLP